MSRMCVSVCVRVRARDFVIACVTARALLLTCQLMASCSCDVTESLYLLSSRCVGHAAGLTAKSASVTRRRRNGGVIHCAEWGAVLGATALEHALFF